MDWRKATPSVTHRVACEDTPEVGKLVVARCHSKCTVTMVTSTSECTDIKVNKTTNPGGP